jgi:hypothetical protein
MIPPDDYLPEVQEAWAKALDAAKEGDARGELSFFILGQMLVRRAVAGRDMEATEADARLLASVIMGSFAVRPLEPEERVVLPPGGLLGRPDPDRN